MPASTERQARFMRAAAHDKGIAKRAGISQKVARDFMHVGRKAKRKGRTTKRGGRK